MVEVTEEYGLTAHAVEMVNTLLGCEIIGLRRLEKDYLRPAAEFKKEVGNQVDGSLFFLLLMSRTKLAKNTSGCG